MGRSDAANFDFKTNPELAAGKYRISLKSKLRHLASILDGRFVAGYRSWDGLGNIESRCFSDHLTSKRDGFGNHLDSILDACNLSHLASILDALTSKLAEIIARFDIRASKIKAR